MRVALAPQFQDNEKCREEAAIIGKCVHCGFCTATCPTYVLLGDELDSPRGRITLIKAQLESGARPSTEFVTHIDRCLSCLSCMTTCPSEVNYQRLIDQARLDIELAQVRPWRDRLLRAAIANILPYPRRFRGLVRLGMVGRSLLHWLPQWASMWVGKRDGMITAAFALLPKKLPRLQPLAAVIAPVSPATGASSQKPMRVALLAGCAQSVLAPEINQAAASLLTRLGCTLLVPPSGGCCGAIVHHMGREAEAQQFARDLIDAWWPLTEAAGGAGLDCIAITTSGCGSVIKDWSYLLREDAQYGERAAKLAAITMDISELLWQLSDQGSKPISSGLGLRNAVTGEPLRIAYHSACSLQHGQRVIDAPRKLLELAGYRLTPIGESHLCCGSAGTYNLLQPKLAKQLAQRKIQSIIAGDPEAIVSGNIGCISQLASQTNLPILHLVQILAA